mgnify:CR=1 FL=1
MRKLFFATVLSCVGLTAIAQEETAELQADDLSNTSWSYHWKMVLLEHCMPMLKEIG